MDFSGKMTLFRLVVLSVVTAQAPIQPEVNVFPKSILLNEGDTFTAYCNFPGIETLDQVNNYPAEWFMGRTRLTYLSSVDAAIKDKRIKVEVKAQAGNSKNLTAALTITQIKATDKGEYLCKVNDLQDTTMLNIRRAIQKLEFMLEKNSKYNVNIGDVKTARTITIDHGEYAPVCVVEGSIPNPNVEIHLGSEKLQGREFGIVGKDGVQFIANSVRLSPQDDGSVLKCMASVPGLSGSEVHRGFQIVVNKLQPTFMCEKSYAMPGDRRHKMVCHVSNVQNIDCNDIIWENTATNEQFSLGQSSGVLVTCTRNDDSSATTKLEIGQLKEEHFTIEWAVVYKFDHGLSNRFLTTITHPKASIPFMGPCFKPTEHCPETKEDYERRSRLYNCTGGKQYTCILYEEYTLAETCSYIYHIPANVGGCPTMRKCDDMTGPQLVPQTEYYSCPQTVKDCPLETHASYNIYELYLYPACIRKYREERVSSRTTMMHSRIPVLYVTTGSLILIMCIHVQFRICPAPVPYDMVFLST